MIFDVTGKLEFVCRPQMTTVAVNGLTNHGVAKYLIVLNPA